MPGDKLHGYGHQFKKGPEEVIMKKAPKRPRKNEGLTQGTKGRKQHLIHQSPAGRVAHGKALIKALMGRHNSKHPHDGSK